MIKLNVLNNVLTLNLRMLVEYWSNAEMYSNEVELPHYCTITRYNYKNVIPLISVKRLIARWPETEREAVSVSFSYPCLSQFSWNTHLGFKMF